MKIITLSHCSWPKRLAVWLVVVAWGCFAWGGPPQAWAGLQLSPKTRLSDVKKQLRPRRIALLIGVSRYRHKSWSDLRYPSKDVARMRRFLKREGQFDEIVSLILPHQTTKQGVRRGLRWLKQRNRSIHDTILVYVSGHGTIAQRRAGTVPERYLVTTDSDRDVPKTGVALASIRRHLKGLPSQRKVVILATCYVGPGGVKRRRGAVKGLTSGIKGTYQLGWVSRATLVLSAAGYMQPAYELASVKGDVYTHFLLSCARALLKKRQRVTAAQAHHCATPLTYKYVQKSLGRRQTPLIESKITGRDTLYIAGQPAPKPGVIVPPIQMGWIKLKRSQYQKVSIQAVGKKGAPQEIAQSPYMQRWELRTGQAEGFLLLRLLPGQYRLLIESPGRGRSSVLIKVLPGQTRLLSPELKSDNAKPSLPSYLDYFEYPEMGLFVSLVSDLHVLGIDRLQFSGRFGFFSRYVSAGFAMAFGPSPPAPGVGSDVLFRMGLYGQFGIPWRFSRCSLFFNLYTELGLWLTYEPFHIAEPVFLLLYGPNVRFRWWITDTVALRLSVAFLFSVSQDQRIAGSQELAWSHRPQLAFGVGFDFGFPSWR